MGHCSLYVDGRMYLLSLIVMEERRTWARGNSSRRRSRYGADDDLTSLDVDGGWDSLVADGGWVKTESNHRQPRIDYVSC